MWPFPESQWPNWRWSWAWLPPVPTSGPSWPSPACDWLRLTWMPWRWTRTAHLSSKEHSVFIQLPHSRDRCRIQLFWVCRLFLTGFCCTQVFCLRFWCWFCGWNPLRGTSWPMPRWERPLSLCECSCSLIFHTPASPRHGLDAYRAHLPHAAFPVEPSTVCACGSSWPRVCCGWRWSATICRLTSTWLRSGWSKWREKLDASLQLTFKERSASSLDSFIF